MATEPKGLMYGRTDRQTCMLFVRKRSILNFFVCEVAQAKTSLMCM